MLEEIKRFMMKEDPNGAWDECTAWEIGYMYDTLNEWIDDGLEETERVKAYTDWLRSQFTGGLW